MHTQSCILWYLQCKDGFNSLWYLFFMWQYFCQRCFLFQHSLALCWHLKKQHSSLWFGLENDSRPSVVLFPRLSRNEHVHNTTEETKILFLNKKLIASFFFVVVCCCFVLNTASAQNLTKAENIVRMKVVLIKIVSWVPSQIRFAVS